mmetsp:Transcript_64583/g.129871  ORF Transcript_64583/g.129871 Transcript_64583/m.129871 type:complete len:128 (-) Transcript_64583:1564-1947(-)
MVGVWQGVRASDPSSHRRRQHCESQGELVTAKGGWNSAKLPLKLSLTLPLKLSLKRSWKHSRSRFPEWTTQKKEGYVAGGSCQAEAPVSKLLYRRHRHLWDIPRAKRTKFGEVICGDYGGDGGGGGE